MPLAQQYTTSVRPNLNWPTNSSAVCGIPQSLCSSPIRWATDSTRSIPWKKTKKVKCGNRRGNPERPLNAPLSPLLVLTGRPRHLHPRTLFHKPCSRVSALLSQVYRARVITNLSAHKAVSCITGSSEHTMTRHRRIWQRKPTWVNE